MLNTTTLRISLAGAIAALALTAPAASAKVDYDPALNVCQEATHVSVGGDLFATDEDPNPPARYQENLFKHRGKGRGLQNAARQSGALALCDPDHTVDPGDGGGFDPDTGGGWGGDT